MCRVRILPLILYLSAAEIFPSILFMINQAPW
jgi:hypothetical protein